MNPWIHRTHEERHLLNPAFCSALLWFASKGAMANAHNPRKSLYLVESFIILPLVLHQKTRQSIPNILASSLPVWVNNQPLHIANLPLRAKSLVPYTKEAIIFGGTNGILTLQDDQIIHTPDNNRSMNRMLNNASAEVKECMKKSEFIGKWFAHTGTPETIFTLFGIRP